MENALTCAGDVMATMIAVTTVMNSSAVSMKFMKMELPLHVYRAEFPIQATRELIYRERQLPRKSVPLLVAHSPLEALQQPGRQYLAAEIVTVSAKTIQELQSCHFSLFSRRKSGEYYCLSLIFTNLTEKKKRYTRMLLLDYIECLTVCSFPDS